MPKSSRFYLMFHVNSPAEAYMFYQAAFGAKKIHEEFLPNGDAYITMVIHGTEILLRPGNPISSRGMACCVNFAAADDLRRAYSVLIPQGRDYWLDTNAHWTPLCASVTDKYGVGWFFCV